MFIFFIKDIALNRANLYNIDRRYIMENKMLNECENDFCDLNPEKICDNCCKCIETDKNYKIIKITKVISDEE